MNRQKYAYANRKDPGVAIDDAGIAALNKTRPGVQFAQVDGSDPKRPTYAVSLEVFHQLHCLVSP